MDSRTALELTKLRMQLGILQTLVLRHDVTMPVLAGKQTLAESVRRTLKVLEESADFAERLFLSDAALEGLGDSERALYAEEFREIVEKMKSYVGNLAK